MNHSKIEFEINEINKCIINLNKNINSIDKQIKNEIELEEYNNLSIKKNLINHLKKNKKYISEQSSFSRALTNISRSGKKNNSISPDSLKEVSEIINKTNKNLLDKNIIGDYKKEFKINPYFRHSFHSSKSISKKNKSIYLNNTFFQDNFINEKESEKNEKKIENNIRKMSDNINNNKILSLLNSKKKNMNNKDNIGKKINYSPNKNMNNTVSLTNFNSAFNNKLKLKNNNIKRNRNERGSFDFNKTMPSFSKSFKGNILKNKLKDIKLKNINKICKVRTNENKIKNEIISPRKKKIKPLIFQEYKSVNNESLDNIYLVLKEINGLIKDENNDKINSYSDLIKNDKNFKEMINYANKINDLYKKCCVNKKFLEIKTSLKKNN